MKRSIIATTLTLCVGCAAGIAVRDLVVPARAQNAAGATYQFAAFKIDWNTDPSEVEKVLNNYGRQGFHLAGTMNAGAYQSNLLFERPLGVAHTASATPPAPSPER